MLSRLLRTRMGLLTELCLEEPARLWVPGKMLETVSVNFSLREPRGLPLLLTSSARLSLRCVRKEGTLDPADAGGGPDDGGTTLRMPECGEPVRCRRLALMCIALSSDSSPDESDVRCKWLCRRPCEGRLGVVRVESGLRYVPE